MSSTSISFYLAWLLGVLGLVIARVCGVPILVAASNAAAVIALAAGIRTLILVFHPRTRPANGTDLALTCVPMAFAGALRVLILLGAAW